MILIRPIFILLLSMLLSAPLYAESSLSLSSPSFKEGESIPIEFTCDGKNSSPALHWKDLPRNTESLVLILQDPDAPSGIFTHWVIFNLPPPIDGIPSGMPPLKDLMNAEKQALNDFGKVGYGGPCPPNGMHHYIFTLYALDNTLRVPGGASKEEVLKAMEGHVLAEAKLTATYKRK
jgi:Raf kinase inhibitor-like YbhB/YbcL family protein